MASNVDEQQLGLRLQEEHKSLQQLSRVLKQHIANQPHSNVGPWLEGLRAAFDRLHVHIERNIEMKTRDGYLETILSERPTLARQVEAVRSEHGQLLRLSQGLQADLAAIQPEENLLVTEACRRAERFMTVVAEHERRENMIVMFAFNQDLGGY